ncbi:unnamed protein product, partial [Closterium sp. NIES-54]
MKEHVEHLRKVFEILRKNKFYVKLSKSDFALKKVQFLGHMVSAEGVHVDPRKIEAVKKWKVPENMKELQQFLGFTNNYNRFVPQYAKIAAPLTDLLKKDTPFKWDTPHQQAMEQLQTALNTAPVLILPDPKKDYVVEADASDQAVGVVLMQDHGNGLQPIAYLSKKLHGAELNYPIHDKEALAIVIAFKAWRCYLEGAKTTVYTDHCSLKYLKSQPTLSRRQIWVPNYAPLRQILLEEFHDVPYAGHFGSNKTLAGIAKYYYWPRMASDVQQFVTSCDTCQRMKSSKQKKTGLLQPLPVPEQPWQVVSLDFITGLPSTSRGNDSILVVIDKFSKMGHFIPTNATATAEATARLFFDRIITIHGIPATLISDRDPKFTTAHDFVTTMQQLWEKTQRRLTTMQNSQKQYADRQRRDHSVAVGDQVLLDTRILNLSHLPSKLRPRFCGPFLVEAQVTPVTFRLRLPDTWKLHSAFHVQLLKPYKDPNQQFKGRQLPPPPPVLVQDEPEYEVERVLTYRRRGGKTLEFLLRWKGYDPTEDSWVAEADMGNARRALKDYLDRGVDQFTPASQRVTHCMCARTGRHLAMVTRQLGSSLYTLTTASPSIGESGQVAACPILSMASRVLVTGLPRSLPPLPPGLAPTCVPCIEGRQHAAPHSSEFSPTEAPLQTLHMDVWGPARVRGQGHERYFLLVVDDYSRYTTVFPLRSKGDVTE